MGAVRQHPPGTTPPRRRRRQRPPHLHPHPHDGRRDRRPRRTRTLGRQPPRTVEDGPPAQSHHQPHRRHRTACRSHRRPQAPHLDRQGPRPVPPDHRAPRIPRPDHPPRHRPGLGGRMAQPRRTPPASHQPGPIARDLCRLATEAAPRARRRSSFDLPVRKSSVTDEIKVRVIGPGNERYVTVRSLTDRVVMVWSYGWAVPVEFLSDQEAAEPC